MTLMEKAGYRRSNANMPGVIPKLQVQDHDRSLPECHGIDIYVALAHLLHDKQSCRNEHGNRGADDVLC